MRLLLMVRAFQVMGHYAGALKRLLRCAAVGLCTHRQTLPMLDHQLLHTLAFRSPAGPLGAGALEGLLLQLCLAADRLPLLLLLLCCYVPDGTKQLLPVSLPRAQPSWTLWAWMSGRASRSWTPPTTASPRRTWTGSKSRKWGGSFGG